MQLSTYTWIIISLNGFLRPETYPDKSLPITDAYKLPVQKSLEFIVFQLSLTFVYNGLDTPLKNTFQCYKKALI